MNLIVKKVESKARAKLEAMVKRAKDPRAFLKRVTYDQYIKAQLMRFETEGKSELGKRWKKLTTKYREWKLKKYAKAAYNGRRIGIATGTLLRSLVERRYKYHRVLINDRGLIIATTVPYARYYDEIRSISKWSKGTISTMKRDYMRYVRGK